MKQPDITKPLIAFAVFIIAIFGAILFGMHEWKGYEQTKPVQEQPTPSPTPTLSAEQMLLEQRKQELEEATKAADAAKALLELKEQHLATIEAVVKCNEEGQYGGMNGLIIDNEERYNECQRILIEWQKIAPLYEDSSARV